MFQNINEDTIDYDSKNTSEDKNKVNIFANIFTKDNIVLYLVSFCNDFNLWLHQDIKLFLIFHLK